MAMLSLAVRWSTRTPYSWMIHLVELSPASVVMGPTILGRTRQPRPGDDELVCPPAWLWFRRLESQSGLALAVKPWRYSLEVLKDDGMVVGCVPAQAGHDVRADRRVLVPTSDSAQLVDDFLRCEGFSPKAGA